MQLFVIAGHGAGDSGACGHGFSEAERVRALAQRIKDFGGDNVILGDFNRNYYADGGINWLDLSTDVPIVELHMDAASPDAHGGHVIIQAGVGGADQWDRNLEGLIAGMFPGRASTLVERDDLANPWRASNRGFNYRLVENGFITNWNDLCAFNHRIDELAKGYLAAFGINAGDAPEPAPAPAPSPDIPDAPAVGEFEAGAYRCNVDCLNVRDAPGLHGNVVAQYFEGEIVNLDSWYTVADGYVWGRYTSWTDETRYIAVGLPTGKPEPDDYLLKV